MMNNSINRNKKQKNKRSDSIDFSTHETSNSYSSEDSVKITASNSSDNDEIKKKSIYEDDELDESDNCYSDDNEDILFDKLKIKTIDKDPFRNAPFKKKTSASSSLTTSSNSIKIVQSATLNSNEQLHKSAFQPYKRPEDPFTNAPFEMKISNRKKVNPFFNVPFKNHEIDEIKHQNQFDYSKFCNKKKSKKSLKEEATYEDYQTEKNTEMAIKNEKLTSLTQSQSLNSITTTANVNAASIISSVLSANPSNTSSSTCTGTIITTSNIVHQPITTTKNAPTTIIVASNNNAPRLSPPSSVSSSCTSFAMNLIDKPVVESLKSVIIKQKSSTLPPLPTPIQSSVHNSVKISTPVKPKQSPEGLITTVYVNNNEFDKNDSHKISKSSTPNRHASANNSYNEDSDNKSNYNNREKQQKSTLIPLANTPLKTTTGSNKGFSNMSFNDS